MDAFRSCKGKNLCDMVANRTPNPETHRLQARLNRKVGVAEAAGSEPRHDNVRLQGLGNVDSAASQELQVAGQGDGALGDSLTNQIDHVRSFRDHLRETGPDVALGRILGIATENSKRIQETHHQISSGRDGTTEHAKDGLQWLDGNLIEDRGAGRDWGEIGRRIQNLSGSGNSGRVNHDWGLRGVI